jgi:hypothetical protein
MSNGIIICNTESTNSINSDIISNNNNIDMYNIRATCNGMDTFSATSKVDCKDNEDDRNGGTESDGINIFRYKFTQEFMDELYKFSKIHQYDHRKDFKEAWKIWTEENDELIVTEIRRLDNLGYEGDIIDKMFKSARYYYRKKSTEKKAPKQRRVYVGLQKELLESMDKHINENISNKEFKPSTGFDNYCGKNIDLLKLEINRLLSNGIKCSEDIKNKIKKTYKNRYFIAINK